MNLYLKHTLFYLLGISYALLSRSCFKYQVTNNHTKQMISFTMMYSKEKIFRLIFSKKQIILWIKKNILRSFLDRLYNTLYRIIHVNYYNPTDMDIIFYKINYADNSPHQFYYINIIIFQA